MRRSVARGAALAAMVGVIGFGLAGCGAGRDSQTAETRPSIAGVDAASPDQTILVRDAAIVFPGPEGYAVGDDAPIQMMIFNQSETGIQLVEARSGASRVTLGQPAPTPAAPSPTPSPTASPSPGETPAPGATASPSPGATASPEASPAPPAAAPEISIPASGYAQVTVVVNRLEVALDGTNSVPLQLVFNNGETIDFNAPMAVPLEPLPRPDSSEPAHT